MNRRTFFTFLAALPLVGMLPAVRAAAGPRTVDELRESMEDIFADARDMEPRAFQEFEVPGGHGGPGYVYRIVPFVWRRIGNSERELVAEAWRQFKAASKGSETGTLFWRRMPQIHEWRDFENGRDVLVLRFRVAIRPADWQARAAAGVDGEEESMASFRAIADSEGSEYRALS